MDEIFGNGVHLGPLQMGIRALLMFFAALVLIRIGGLRIMGKKSSFDLVIIIMMGSVLARGIVGASPPVSAFAAASVMIAVNRMLAWASAKNLFLNQLFKGRPLVLYTNEEINWQNMERACLSYSDLLTSLRLEVQHDSLDSVAEARLETNGRISFLIKPDYRFEN